MRTLQKVLHTADPLQKALLTMAPISLAEMDDVALLNRTDTKFIFSRAQLVPILELLRDDYMILEVDGDRQIPYSTQYFDTETLDFFLSHHNGRKNRVKVRIREYVNSGLQFLEVKKKKNTGKTEKARIKVTGFNGTLRKEDKAFIQAKYPQVQRLSNSLNNSFKRITLVHKTRKERFTIDCDLAYSSNGKSTELPKLVIAEVKQEKASRNTESVALLKELGIRSQGISKYCLGIILLKPNLKYNNFKPTQRFIENL